MTGSNDIDRLLGVYLDDGPRRAPERAVDAAIAHARAHPRRRDPLLFLRPDVMGRRPALFSPQLAWAMLVLALTVGMVAAVAIGSRPDQAPVVPPPSVVGSPSPSVEPSAPPETPEPTKGGVPEVPIRVDLDNATGADVSVDIVDNSETVVNAVSGTPGDGASVEAGTLQIENIDARTLRLSWVDFPIDNALTLYIEGDAARFVLIQPDPTGPTDAVAHDRELILTFNRDIAAAGIEASLQNGIDTPGE
jgi:hypothetical protein